MAIAYGIPENTFFHSTPKRLKRIYQEIEIKSDYEMWKMGIYFMKSLESTVCNGYIWRNKGQKAYEYPNRPLFVKEVEKEENKNAENKEEIAVFEMKQRIKLLEQQGLPQSPM